MLTEKEIAIDVDKLIKIYLEMKVVTRYKSKEAFSIQKLSLWSNGVLKEERKRARECILKD